jgi:hypothetical protein
MSPAATAETNQLELFSPDGGANVSSHKRCKHCGEVKPASEFRARRNQCRVCEKAYQRARATNRQNSEVNSSKSANAWSSNQCLAKQYEAFFKHVELMESLCDWHKEYKTAKIINFVNSNPTEEEAA